VGKARLLRFHFLIGLQESDTNRISGGNSDIVRYFADRLDLYAYYGPKVVPGTFGIALLAYVAGFMLVAILDLNVQARTASTRVDAARIRYLAGGGLIALILQVVDKLGHVINVDIPPLGLAFTLLYLYVISQAIVRYRILDLYELFGRLAVMTLMGFVLALIYLLVPNRTLTTLSVFLH